MGKHVELLAPAGSYEAFLGAVNAGADAVYLGGHQFGARAYADNFDADEIVRALRVAHFYGKKIYLTVNTLLKEREMSSLYEYLAPFYEAGLDGVIVQDFGAFCYIRDHFPGLALHVSTQMTVTGAGGAALLKELGAKRIVPARELSLEEVKKIREAADVEVECFIHGAMCYSYSGQCLFSSILGGRSGNRGRCAQPCRLPYEIFDGKKKLSVNSHPLSLKDMCTLEYLPALLEAGIDSFKIEGRMKRPAYAAGVTAIYRKYIDLYYSEGASVYRVDPQDMDRLRRLYIRSEIQTGYYERHNGREMITPGDPGYAGCDETLLSEIESKYIREPEKMPVRMRAYLKAGEPLRLRMEAVDGNHAEPSAHPVIEMTGETIQPAKSAPLAAEDVIKRLCKTGESLLTVESCEVSLKGACFVPVRALNELRRAAVEAFEKTVAESLGMSVRRALQTVENTLESKNIVNRPSQSISGGAHTNSSEEKSETKNTSVDVTIHTREQLKAALAWGGCRRIYMESDLFIKSHEEMAQLIGSASRHHGDDGMPVFYLALPPILRGRDEGYLRRLEKMLDQREGCVQGFLVRNLEGLAWTKDFSGIEERRCAAYDIVPDAGLYCFNADALAFFKRFSDEITLPYELNAGEAAYLVRTAKERGMSATLIAYSRIPMMITANCLKKTAGICGADIDGGGMLSLKDRKSQTFPVEINCNHCYNVIYNAVPYSLHGAKKERERIGADALRYDFTMENAVQCTEILEGNFPFADYTAGHCKRGVE